MPVPTPDPSGASTPTTPLYVWESLRQPGDYALCTDPQHGDFQNSNWRFRGELATVPELDGFPRPSIANGWPIRVHRHHPPSGDDRQNGSFGWPQISSAWLILGLAAAAPAAAAPFIFGTADADERMEAAERFSINLLPGWSTAANNLQSLVLLSMSPLEWPLKDIDNSDIQFPVSAHDFESWPGEDWLP